MSVNQFVIVAAFHVPVEEPPEGPQYNVAILYYPINQLVPLEYTGTLFAPPPATIDAKVVAVASETKALAPAPPVVAEGNAATNTAEVYTADHLLLA
jgi:hypothetical protein